MHCKGDISHAQRAEELIRQTNNYVLVEKSERHGDIQARDIESAVITLYYIVYFKKGTAKRVEKNRYLLWHPEHASIKITYDTRPDARYGGSIFINLLDYNKILTAIPELANPIWRMKQEAKGVHNERVSTEASKESV